MPKQTVPTGLPPGVSGWGGPSCASLADPAMPVMDTPTVAPHTRRTPSAISAAQASLTAPCSARVSGLDPQHPGLDLVGVGHDPAHETSLAPGSVVISWPA